MLSCSAWLCLGFTESFSQNCTSCREILHEEKFCQHLRGKVGRSQSQPDFHFPRTQCEGRKVFNLILKDLSLAQLQGISKRWVPGCVKLGEKVAFCLPTAGRRTQLFHLIFTQPGVHLLEIPCTLRVRKSNQNKATQCTRHALI